MLPVFGRLNEQGGGGGGGGGCCPFSAGSTSGKGGGAVHFQPVQRAGVGCCPLTTACREKSILGQKGG